MTTTTSITWNFNANRTLAETTINGIPCVVYRGGETSADWYYRAGTEFSAAPTTRVDAFKGCLTAVLFIAQYAPEWAATVAA